MLEKGDMLTLDDGKDYTVVETLDYNNKNYCYLIDVNNYENISFCEIINNDELEEVEDEELRFELLEKFNQLLNE